MSLKLGLEGVREIALSIISYEQTSYCNMYDVYLFDILFTWFLLTQILMIKKLFTKSHKIFSGNND